MSDLVKKILGVGGTILYTLMPAQGVSANEVAKEFSNGDKPVVVVEERGRTVGRGNFSVGVEGVYENIETELTAASQSTDGVTVPVNIKNLIDNFDTRTKRRSTFAVGSYGILNGLDINWKIGVAQTDFIVDKKGVESTQSLKSANDLAYGLGIRAVPFHSNNGLYLAITGSWTQGEHKNLSFESTPPVFTNVVNIYNTDWRELAATLETGKKMGRITPYGGIKYTDLKENVHVETPSLKRHNFRTVEAKNPWSVFAGMDVELDKKGKYTLGANVQYGGHKKAFFLNVRKGF